MARLLVISFAFPPYHRVGAKRWYSFADELTQLGHEVTVFTSKSFDKRAYQEDASLPYRVIRVDRRIPDSLFLPKKGVWGSFSFRLFSLIQRIKYPGNFYDFSNGWENYFAHEIPRLISSLGIEHVIITGGPFRYFKYLTDLDLKQVKVTIDFRDPWTTKSGYVITEKRNKEEREMERSSVISADMILTASKDIKTSIEGTFTVDSSDIGNKIFVIENGLDARMPVNNVSETVFLNERSCQHLNLIYYGGIHCNLEHFECFIESIVKYNEESDNTVKLTLYGNTNLIYNEIVRKSGGDYIQVKPRITDTEFLSIAEKTDFFVYFKPFGKLENSFGVKFFDYLRGRRKILLIAPKGDVVDFVENNEIGYVLPIDGMFEYLAKLFEKRLKGEIIYESKQELESELSIKSRAMKIESVLDL
jgi:hypothetical protein